MTELEEKQHEYIQFLQDRLNEAESVLCTQYCWSGFSEEKIKKGRLSNVYDLAYEKYGPQVDDLMYKVKL